MSIYEEKLLEILTIDIEDRKTDISLLNGYAGYCLLSTLYTNLIDNSFFEILNDRINTLLEQINKEQNYSFGTGRSGINWLFLFLYKEKLLGEEDLKILCSNDHVLQHFSLDDLTKGNYDFLHGGLGTAYYLLYHNDSKYSSDYFDNLFIVLDTLLQNSSKIYEVFDFNTRETSSGSIDLGLCHGISSILKFCLQCSKQNIHRIDAERIIKRIIDFLCEHYDANNEKSYFNYGERINGTQVNSRLGWCYGDLGIGIILYQAARILKDLDVEALALNVLLSTTERRDYEDTFICDACVCHGSAGVAHIYNRMWHYTDNPVFKEACDFWMNKTIEFAFYEDGIAGYKKYNAVTRSYEKDCGVLDGVTGIGLVLLSYLTGNFSWDYCIMLND